MIKVGSYFINRHEYITAENDIEKAEFGQEAQSKARKATTATNIMLEDDTRPTSLIDRGEIALDLYRHELDF